jgi:succinate dehydrogenase/fumarate reductase flavoprotein subunit
MGLQETIETDVLVIGGGFAGCFAAIKAKGHGLTVTLVDKGYAGKSGAGFAAGMGYMVFNREWGLDLNDCIEAINSKGEYLNNRQWTEIVFRDSWQTYQDLVSWGVDFPVEGSSQIVEDFLPFGIVRIKRRKVTPFMRQQAMKAGVRIMDRVMVSDLLKQDGKVVGALGFPMDREDLVVFKAKATVLSTGYNSFKPAGAEIHCLTGDGEAMAYRAGAQITCKEFLDSGNYGMMPYPSWRGGRGSRACFRNYTDGEGKRVKTDRQNEADLTLDFAIHAGRGPILWDLDSSGPDDIERMRKRMENSDAIESARMGFDPGNGGKFVQVGGGAAGAPNAQTGGVWPIDTNCATRVPGLFVAGECCGTRYLGAYHPAPGFGLTGSAVTGSRAGHGAAEYAKQMKVVEIDGRAMEEARNSMILPMVRKNGYSPRWVTQLLQNTMMPYFILFVKHEKRLQAALTIVEFLRDHLSPKLTAKDNHELRLAHETKNMILNAEMILRTSLARTESRGQHYREDYPRRNDDDWLVWLRMEEREGVMELSKEPVPAQWRPDSSLSYEERYPKRFPGE